MSPESTLHVFIYCPATRALWFGSGSGLKLDCVQLSSPSNLIELLLSPPIGLATVFNLEAYLLYGILILDQGI